MAIIGAEGQRGLSYALRREEQKNNTRDDRTARQRATLANKLTEASFDPDIDNPSLAYYATAMNADPTGIVGGIASALGSVQMMKAADTKRDALKTEREMDASLLMDRLNTAFGEGQVEQSLSKIDPRGEQRNNPDLLAKLYDNLDRNRKEGERATDRAIEMAETGLRFTEIAEKIDEKNNAAGMQRVVQQHLEDEFGLKPAEALFLSQDPSARSKFIGDKAWKLIDLKNRQKLYNSMKDQLGSIGMTEQMFLTLNELPAPIATQVFQESMALTGQPQVQILNSEISNLQSNLRDENSNAYTRAMDSLIPFQIPGEAPGEEPIPTPEFKRWVVNYANANKGSDIDLDDPLDEQYAEAIGELGRGNYNNLGRMYQQDMASKSETFNDDMQGLISADPSILSILNNLNSKRERLKNVYASNPAYQNSPIKTLQYSEQIDKLSPGVFFRMPNGGVFVTVGDDTHQSVGVSHFNMSPESIHAPSLKKEGTSFTPSMNSRRNAGYRPVTKEEMEDAVNAIEGIMSMPINDMPKSGKEEDKSGKEEEGIFGGGVEKDVTGGISGDTDTLNLGNIFQSPLQWYSK